jgi:hypothetical protein
MLRQGDDGWANPKVLVIFAMIFVCGAAFGCALTRSYLHARFHPPPPGLRQHFGMDAAQHIGLKGLAEVLNLTPDQEKTVMKELDDYAKYYQNLEDQRDDVAALGKERILQVLNREQKKKFNAIYGQTDR